MGGKAKLFSPPVSSRQHFSKVRSSFVNTKNRLKLQTSRKFFLSSTFQTPQFFFKKGNIMKITENKQQFGMKLYILFVALYFVLL